MLLPFIVKNESNEFSCETLNTDFIASVIQSGEDEYNIEYILGNKIRHIIASDIPKNLSQTGTDSPAILLKIFQSDYLSRIENAFEWACDVDSLKIISMSSAVDANQIITITVIYSTEF